MPLLEAILQSQPTIKIKNYQHTSIAITMPKNRRKKNVAESNHTLNRWQALAGINRPDNK